MATRVPLGRAVSNWGEISSLMSAAAERPRKHTDPMGGPSRLYSTTTVQQSLNHAILDGNLAASFFTCSAISYPRERRR
jgi:hypothetical protein